MKKKILLPAMALLLAGALIFILTRNRGETPDTAPMLPTGESVPASDTSPEEKPTPEPTLQEESPGTELLPAEDDGNTAPEEIPASASPRPTTPPAHMEPVTAATNTPQPTASPTALASPSSGKTTPTPSPTGVPSSGDEEDVIGGIHFG